jgi:hypothetical protein
VALEFTADSIRGDDHSPNSFHRRSKVASHH